MIWAVRYLFSVGLLLMIFEHVHMSCLSLSFSFSLCLSGCLCVAVLDTCGPYHSQGGWAWWRLSSLPCHPGISAPESPCRLGALIWSTCSRTHSPEGFRTGGALRTETERQHRHDVKHACAHTCTLTHTHTHPQIHTDTHDLFVSCLSFSLFLTLTHSPSSQLSEFQNKTKSPSSPTPSTS